MIGGKYIKSIGDSTDPVWVREGGANYTHSKMSAKAAAKLDEPEGAVIIEVSATLYLTFLEIAKRAEKLANTINDAVDPLAGQRGPGGKL